VEGEYGGILLAAVDPLQILHKRGGEGHQSRITTLHGEHEWLTTNTSHDSNMAATINCSNFVCPQALHERFHIPMHAHRYGEEQLCEGGASSLKSVRFVSKKEETKRRGVRSASA
jgi:hypothetical protein